MAYTKLDEGLTDSTIWQEPDTTRIVWITLLAMADQNGYIGASMPGLAGRARVSLDACIKAIETFLAPDKWSRTKDHEGRRIAEADGGWVLLNHAKYREAQNAADRRERSRVAMAALREKRKTDKQDVTVNTCDAELTKLTQAEADTDTKKRLSPTAHPKPTARGLLKFPPGFETLWAEYPRKVGKDAAAKAFAKRRPDADLLAAMVSAVRAQRQSEQWRKDSGQFVPHLSTWLNEGRWKDEAGPSEARSDDIFAGAR